MLCKKRPLWNVPPAEIEGALPKLWSLAIVWACHSLTPARHLRAWNPLVLRLCAGRPPDSNSKGVFSFRGIWLGQSLVPGERDLLRCRSWVGEEELTEGVRPCCELSIQPWSRVHLVLVCVNPRGFCSNVDLNSGSRTGSGKLNFSEAPRPSQQCLSTGSTLNGLIPLEFSQVIMSRVSSVHSGLWRKVEACIVKSHSSSL